MLALPDTWDYSIRGLAKISKEGVDCIRATDMWNAICLEERMAR